MSTRPLTRTKKLAFSLVATCLLLSILEGLLYLGGVEPAYLRDDPYVGFASHIPHFVPVSGGGATKLLSVAPSKRDVLNPVTFQSEKPTGTYRVFCLGGSTTYGRPFFDETSFAGWLRAFLPAADRSKRWEVINAGAVSYASYRVAGLMQELARYQPDLFVIYTGHNEFLERRTYEQLLNQPQWLRDWLSLTRHSRTMTVVRRVLERTGVAPHPQSQRSQLPDQVKRIPVDAVGPEAYHRDAQLRRQVIDHFRMTLQRMMDIADRVGANVVLIVPASNIADFAPFKSQHVKGLTPQAAARWRDIYGRALQLTQKARLQEALAALEAAESIDNRRADLHFAKGQVLLALKRYREAGKALNTAKQEDICPLRAIDELVEVVRAVGSSRRAVMADFYAIAAQHSDHNIPNRKVFHDHVHPTIEANRLLALQIIEQLASGGVVTLDHQWNAETIRHITAKVRSGIDQQLYARQLLALTALLSKLGQQGMARQQALAAFELSGRSVDVGMAVGRLLMQMKATALAEKVTRELVADHPDSAPARCQLGRMLLSRRQIDQALPQLGAALKLDPDLAEAHQLAGLANAEKGEMPEAERHFRAAARLSPATAAAHENLGLSVARQGRYAEAISHYEQALKLDPASPNTHRNMALALQALGRGGEAKEHEAAANRLEHADQAGGNRSTPANP